MCLCACACACACACVQFLNAIVAARSLTPEGKISYKDYDSGSLKREVGIHCLVCLQYNNGCLMANA